MSQNKPPSPDSGPQPAYADPMAFARIMAHVAERSQPLLQKFMELHQDPLPSAGDLPIDPMNVGPAYIRFFSELWSNPQKMMELQTQFWSDWAQLWQESAKKFMGQPGETMFEPESGDRRFKAPQWQESAIFDFIKQSYLLTAKWAERTVDSVETLNVEERSKIDFLTRQIVNAMAPTNFLLTNPEVLQETIDTNGENLIRGLENLLEDLERGNGALRISTTDTDAFKLGENLAVTPGKVIFQNRLMQLIQYEAQTENVFKRPLLIVPPWINKYYILDLRPENSLIDWLVKQGHTVFTISWINPDQSMAHLRFEDYLEDGILEAVAQVKNATGETDINALGYCLGGTLLTIALAYLNEQKRNDIASATFLTTLIDFEQAGELKLFMDDQQFSMLKNNMAQKGYLDAESFRRVFALLRSNDMIWSFVVNNYLMGREPFPFDMLYWNEDATNMPAEMHGFYIENFYRQNLLKKPGALTMKNVALDVTKIKTPAYFLSTKEDHIAPWKATFEGAKLFNGPVQFTLAASGHVAGVVNPPAKNKYCYWSSPDKQPAPDTWLENATQTAGSWWPHWQEWVKPHAGEQIPARKITATIIEDAPGSYVKRASD